ncbi:MULTISPECIES: o-succinylbenzoate synthase [Pseudonocardia]|uniref:o-succinylbenzoate synthase n=2 Tax=Pseudonocardia TaxID=1847 RepID=A0A1Y2MVQ0_PSEAH|nr:MULTISPECIES: o-succinylbenzoate synthase [Pseudonocardia]OSY39246.1 L-Ala-D/L-Glu epimerase [Pseudonocardia autotrophica]TDN76532.1 O-succinylbenzoate synthase [Pseudonocardia autotrophica]BBG00532.1 o-succinylbenzoate synthase [Pseudonocardia autotrophica]GEC26492.1 o-succinylbenzoate synthase [Pseudonocardia saturnea]
MHVYALGMTTRFRGITVREGLLLHGAAGWGEFCPFPEYDDREALAWLAAAREAAEDGWPEPVRDRVPVNCTVPAVEPGHAQRIVLASGATTAKVKVAEPGAPAGADEERVAAVRDALGPTGLVRVDANGAWPVDDAIAAIRRIERAAGGLEYVEQPCATVEELAAVRRAVDVPIAADESVRRADDPMRVVRAGAADIVVLKVAPLGGVRRALRIAAECGLPVVVSSAVESSVGLAAGLALAGALPELHHACGLGTAALLADDVVADADRLLPDAGTLPVPRRAPDPVRRVQVAAPPERDAWWRARYARVAALS